MRLKAHLNGCLVVRLRIGFASAAGSASCIVVSVRSRLLLLSEMFGESTGVEAPRFVVDVVGLTVRQL